MNAIDVFFCYAHEDEGLLRDLKSHLSILRREKLINVWYDRDINAGAEWASEIDQHLNTAQLILLLISPNFMDSEYCYGIEMKRALDRHKRGEARVIPIILRPIAWQKAPFGGLLVLPTDGKAVKSSHWHNADEAFVDVADGIRKAVEKLQKNSLKNSMSSTLMSLQFQEGIAKGRSIQDALQDCHPGINNLFQLVLTTIDVRCSNAVANGISVKDALEKCYPGMGNLFQPMIDFIRDNDTNYSQSEVLLQAQIEKLLQEVSAVGDGDLRVEAETTPDTLGILADSFNYMIEELAKVVGRTRSVAIQTINAAHRILDRLTEQTQASETQVAQISQTIAVIETLTTFIQNVANDTQLNIEMAQEALRYTKTGQQSARQATEGMILIPVNMKETSKKIKRVGERSNEISEIVHIIQGAADQINLLALNAAIQSAMAGGYGHGFATAANEIRALTERLTESTKRIATLVKSIQIDTYEAVVAVEDSTQETIKGLQLIDEADRALKSIYGTVERQTQIIDNIPHAANEKIAISKTATVTMGDISEVTRQSNTGVQEMVVSVSYMAELSEQLRASVSTFRLPEPTNNS